MRILPLVLHAMARVPALTTLFSDPIAVSSLSVTQGGLVKLTTPAPHLFTVGGSVPLSIVDYDAPNQITAAVPDGFGNWTLTTQYPHDLTSPQWSPDVSLSGFTADQLNGTLQLVSTNPPDQFTVKPSSGVGSVTLNGSEALLERLEDGIVGWHKMTVTSPTELAFPCPSDVTRSYTVANPQVVKNIRIFGSVDLQTAKSQYAVGYAQNRVDQDQVSITNAWMAICPSPSVAMSRDRMAQTDAIAEITPQADFRQLVTDGFLIYVFLPAEMSSGGIESSDLASGEMLATVLRTFHGLVLPRSELFQANTYIAYMAEHGGGIGDYDKATYIHGYHFQAPAYLTQWDSIRPFEWSSINESTMTASSGLGTGRLGGQLDTSGTSVPPIGSVAFRDLVLQVKHDTAATQPLIATIPLS